MWMVYDPSQHEDALAQLFDRVAAMDGVPALTEHKLMRVGREGHEVVALDGCELVGYAQAASHQSVEGSTRWAVEIVAPDAVVVAGALRAVTEDLVGQHHTVWASSDRIRAAVVEAGYHEVRRLYRLERPLPLGDGPRLPNGLSAATFRVGVDEDAWLEVNNAAFAGHPENGSLTRDDLSLRMSQGWFDPAGLIMAWEGDTLVGSCWTKRHPDATGEIYIIGVHPRARGRGIGRALVLMGLDDLNRRQGCRTGMLYVDGENVAAIWLYTDLGFESVFVNSEYARGDAQ